MLSSDHQNQLVGILKQSIPNLEAVLLYGSAITEHFSSHSDVDVAVWTGKKLDSVYRWEVQEHIARELSRDVDLVDMEACSEVMAYEIVRTGEVIFQNDFDKVNLYLTKVFWLYLDLQENRQKMLDDYLGNG